MIQKAPEVVAEFFQPPVVKKGRVRSSGKVWVLANWRTIGFAMLLLSLLACSAATPTPEPPIPTAQPLGGPEYSAILVTSDLAVGINRVSFGLIDRDGMPVRTEEAQVQSVYLPPGQDTGQIHQTVTARFQQWPGANGVFT